jgi:hypothetical protein
MINAGVGLRAPGSRQASGPGPLTPVAGRL